MNTVLAKAMEQSIAEIGSVGDEAELLAERWEETRDLSFSCSELDDEGVMVMVVGSIEALMPLIAELQARFACLAGRQAAQQTDKKKVDPHG